MKGNESHKEKFEAAATACESVKDLSAARDAASYAASAASAASDAARAASDADRDGILSLMAKIGVNILKKLKSPGCKWLDLCE